MATSAQISSNQHKPIDAIKLAACLLRRLETAIFDEMLKGCIPADDGPRIAAKILNASDRTLATLQRYASAAERQLPPPFAKRSQIRNQPTLTARLPKRGPRNPALNPKCETNPTPPICPEFIS